MINNPAFQTNTAIAIVIICAAWLVLRVWMKRKKPGCGCGGGDTDGDRGCPADEFKRKLAKSEKPGNPAKPEEKK